MRYEFESKNNLNNSYFFTTSFGIVYEIKFRPSAYLLGDKPTVYSHYIYEFIIEVSYNPLDKSPPLDKLISDTIASIILDFYYKKEESVCIYICDSSDGRQDLRRKKFDDWFYSKDKFGLIKIDETIYDSNGIGYPISLIIKNDNPYFTEIVVGFSRLAASYNQGK